MSCSKVRIRRQKNPRKWKCRKNAKKMMKTTKTMKTDEMTREIRQMRYSKKTTE